MVTFLFFERFSCRTNNPSLLRDKGGLLSNKAGLLADEGGGASVLHHFIALLHCFYFFRKLRKEEVRV